MLTIQIPAQVDTCGQCAHLCALLRRVQTEGCTSSPAGAPWAVSLASSPAWLAVTRPLCAALWSAVFCSAWHRHLMPQFDSTVTPAGPQVSAPFLASVVRSLEAVCGEEGCIRSITEVLFACKSPGVTELTENTRAAFLSGAVQALQVSSNRFLKTN